MMMVIYTLLATGTEGQQVKVIKFYNFSLHFPLRLQIELRKSSDLRRDLCKF